MRSYKTLKLVFTLGAAAAAVACGGAKPPEAKAPSASAQASAPETPAQAATSGNVEVSEDILKACGMSEADAYFPFDSAHLERQDIPPLNKIATCFTVGQLKGHAMKLVGRADPRGGPEYNLTLGQSRADAVAKYLSRKGLDKDKVLSTSRGAMDATGTDEASWAHDRRVDILLAG